MKLFFKNFLIEYAKYSSNFYSYLYKDYPESVLQASVITECL